MRRHAGRAHADRPRDAGRAARADVRARRRRRADGPGVAGHPARPRPGAGVRPGRRAVEPDVQRRPGPRPGAGRPPRRRRPGRAGRSSSTPRRSSASSSCCCGGSRSSAGPCDSRPSRSPAPCGPGCATASTRRPCAASSCGRSPSPRRRPPSRRCCRPSCATASASARAATASCSGCFGAGAVLAAVLRPRLDAALHIDHLVMVSTLVIAVGLVLVGGGQQRVGHRRRRCSWPAGRGRPAR